MRNRLSLLLKLTGCFVVLVAAYNVYYRFTEPRWIAMGACALETPNVPAPVHNKLFFVLKALMFCLPVWVAVYFIDLKDRFVAGIGLSVFAVSYIACMLAGWVGSAVNTKFIVECKKGFFPDQSWNYDWLYGFGELLVLAIIPALIAIGLTLAIRRSILKT